MMTPVAGLSEVDEGRVKIFAAGERKVLLVRRDGVVYATEPRCPHARSVLGPGRLTAAGLIECPMHGALFSPVDGSAHKGPTCFGLEIYPAEVRDQTVFVDFEAARPRPDAPPALKPNAGDWSKWTPAVRADTQTPLKETR